MASNAKTKAVVALGLLDIARQLSHAIASKQQVERERPHLGNLHMPDMSLPHLDWLPWKRKPTLRERLGTWGPVGIVIAGASIGLIAVAKWIARKDPELASGQIATDSRMVGAIRAGSHAIDAGVDKVMHGGTAAAVGTASAVAAGTTAVRAAAVDRAKVELDHRVVAPAKKKAVMYGAMGVAAITVYVIVIAVIVQLVVGAIA